MTVKRWAEYDPTTGQILSVRTGTAEEMADRLVVELPTGDDSTYYIDPATGAPVGISAAPSEHHAWNWSTHDWGVALTTIKMALLTQVKSNRDQLLNLTFAWDGSTFDSDQTSQTRLLGLYVAALNTPETFPITWRLADNSWRALSAADAQGVWGALQTHVQGHFTAFAIHEATINALTTVAAAQAYDVTVGWP